MSQYCKMKEAAYMANRHVFSSGIISNAVQAAGAAVQEDLHSKSTLVDAIARSSGWAILYLKADDSSALWKWMFEVRPAGNAERMKSLIGGLRDGLAHAAPGTMTEEDKLQGSATLLACAGPRGSPWQQADVAQHDDLTGDGDRPSFEGISAIAALTRYLYLSTLILRERDFDGAVRQ